MRPQEFAISGTAPSTVSQQRNAGNARTAFGPSSAEQAALHHAIAVETPARRRHVLHVVDTLDAGGKERVAVNLVNALPRDRYRASLCTTRRDGALDDLVAPDVTRLRIERTWRFDLSAVIKTVAFVREHGVDLIHAHGSSLFHARLVALFPPYPAVVWHDHFGRCGEEERPAWMYRTATRGIGGVIAVNSQLAAWARRTLRVRPDRIWYVPNFVAADGAIPVSRRPPSLPGTPDLRIVCVANFRPQKDHLTLIAAMETVARTAPDSHLLLVGDTVDTAYRQAVEREIATRGLEGHVTILGLRKDVLAILRASAIGVLSSASEGLPLALIEYGKGGVAAVSTNVGECAAVLDEGRAGLLVPPHDPAALSTAMLSLLTSSELRRTLSARLDDHVEAHFSQAQGIRQVCEIYEHVFGA